MALQRKSTLTTRKPLRRGKPIKQKGSRTLAWEKLRNDKFDREKDEESLIKCQDYKIGLPPCGIARSSMDLHHTEGRDGKLLLDESKLVWLTRQCHDSAHGRDSDSTSAETPNDEER